jgi:two-component system, cell cycle response regulator DivK
MTKRILVVEDQEDLRGVLRDLLTGSGFDVAEAADGQAGVAKAKSERPDLILMDIQLPGIDGYEASRQIKADPDLTATPIISVSSFAMKGDEQKARASGCDEYVTKPYSPMQLLRLIRSRLGEKV